MSNKKTIFVDGNEINTLPTPVANKYLKVSSDGTAYEWATAGGGPGGSGTLSETLDNGNTTDGYHIVITSASEFRTNDVTGSTSADRFFYSGGSAVNGTGGAFYINAGSTSGSGAGGDISVTSGSSSTGDGGYISFVTGAGDLGGGFEVITGNSNGASSGGDFMVTTGSAADGDGGWLWLNSGGSDNADGGSLSYSAGFSTNGNGGHVELFGGGTGGSGTGGYFEFTGGNSGSGGTGGGFIVTAGNGGNTGGSVVITPGTGLITQGNVRAVLTTGQEFRVDDVSGPTTRFKVDSTGIATVTKVSYPDVTGAPAAISGATVVQRRAVDDMMVERTVTGSYHFCYTPAPVTTSSTSATQFAEIALEADTLITITFSLMAVNRSSPGETISYNSRVQFRCNTSNVVTVEESWLSTPDALPFTPPSWCTAYASLVTTDVATANTAKLYLTPASSTTVKWCARVEGFCMEDVEP